MHNKVPKWTTLSRDPAYNLAGYKRNAADFKTHHNLHLIWLNESISSSLKLNVISHPVAPFTNMV